MLTTFYGNVHILLHQSTEIAGNEWSYQPLLTITKLDEHRPTVFGCALKTANVYSIKI